nr:MAG: ORF1 [Polycipiviridae sp.]
MCITLKEMIEPTANQQNEVDSRAKEIDQGTLPLSMQNVILGLPTKPGLQFDDRSSVKATPWTYEQLISQKQLINVITISKENSKNPGDIHFILPNTWDLIEKMHFRKLKDLFFLKSWKWKLIFEFRSNFQQVGMLALSYVNCPADAYPYLTHEPLQAPGVPYYTSSDGNYGTPKTLGPTALDTPQAIYQLPHRLIFLGEDNDVECTFNWLSPFKSTFEQQAYSTLYAKKKGDTQYDMGQIRLHTIVPMDYSIGVTPTMTVRIYSQLTDVEYSGYMPTDQIL